MEKLWDLVIGKFPGVQQFLKYPIFLRPDVWYEHYLRLLTCTCIILCLVQLPRDQLTGYLHECASVQLLLLKLMVRVHLAIYYTSYIYMPCLQHMAYLRWWSSTMGQFSSAAFAHFTTFSTHQQGTGHQNKKDVQIESKEIHTKCS